MMSSRRPQPVLMDMPKHILEKIIEETGQFKERLPLRQVCRPLRHLTDRLPLHLGCLNVHANSENEEFLKIFFGAKKNSKFPLKIKEISLFQKGTPPLEFFDFLDKKSLKSINIRSENLIDFEIFDKNFFQKFENVKNLELHTLKTLVPIGKLEKFEILNFKIEDLMVQDFEQVLEHFLHSSSILLYRIQCPKIYRNRVVDFLEEAGLEIMSDYENPYWWEFKNLKNPSASFSVAVFPDCILIMRNRK
ncbi:hypothetical protein CAEBREN_13520 [Caenorhabditis brenneri]|uniref:F-box domain-containing protein n=1 Tax=Caenorhabditis brenneri TaxID=135651 RepID=G0MVZ6_CAEBE|nr:hypothetical protein CAEBREN_13520 [Caenorhabditis brenneri]